MEPVYDRDHGEFVPRLMLPLSLSYDHRVIDGADGIRFLRWVVEALEQPFVLALQRMTVRACHGVTQARGSRDFVPRDQTLPNMISTQLVVVGGGPGGYAAAFLAADLGLTSRWSIRKRIPAASASIAAAFRRRRCCTSPR